MSATPGVNGRILWTELTDPEIEHARDHDYLVLLPVGAVEQHGAHLPSGTDATIAQAVAEGVARTLGETIVAPGLPWGYSATHMSFASTLSLRPQTMTSVLEDVCGSLVSHGFTRIAIVSSHATNRPVAQLFVQEFAVSYGVTVAFTHYTDFVRTAFGEARQTAVGGEMHAGEFETSLQLYLQPELVDLDKATSDYVDPLKHFGISTAAKDFTQGGQVTIGYDIRKLFPSGVMGDARPADAALGEALFEHAVEQLAATLDQYRTFDYCDRAKLTVGRTPASWQAQEP